MLAWKLARTQPWGPFRLGIVPEENASTPVLPAGGCVVVDASVPEAGVVLVPVGVVVCSFPAGFSGGAAAGLTSVTTVFDVFGGSDPSPSGGVPVSMTVFA